MSLSLALPVIFPSYFLLVPFEEGEGESSWVGVWQLAKANPPQKLNQSNQTEIKLP